MSAPLPLDHEIHAYADGQLAPEDAARIATLEERDPVLAARIADIRRQNAALRDATDPWLAEPLPPALLRAMNLAPARRGWRRHGWAGLAVAASLVLGVAIGWLGKGEAIDRTGTPVTFQRQAALTHALYAADPNRPVEIWAAEEQRLVNWLTKRLGFPVHAPNLNSAGFSLVGGRLVAGNEKPAALFMYENADKQRISLLVRRDAIDNDETGFRYAVENGVGVFYWIGEGCAYALSGNLEKTQILSIGRIVYGQLAAFDASGSKK